jgi:hypothetical protein
MTNSVRLTIIIATALNSAMLLGCEQQPLTLERNPFASMYYPLGADDPLTLNIIGPVEVDVESFNGDVFVTADHRRREASVRIIRRAVHGPLRHGEGRGALADVSYSAQIVPGELGPRLEVRTFADHPEPHYLRADVHIDVPAVDGLRVRTTNGRVRARGVEGYVDVMTTRGDVRVLTNLPMRHPVRIINDHGDIDYRVRGESEGLIDAEAIGGRVSYRVRHGRLTIDRGSKHDRLFARFNDGENPITLRTRYGNIHIASVHNAERVGTFIID